MASHMDQRVNLIFTNKTNYPGKYSYSRDKLDRAEVFKLQFSHFSMTLDSNLILSIGFRHLSLKMGTRVVFENY